MIVTHLVKFFFGGASGVEVTVSPERGVAFGRTKRISVHRSDRISAMAAIDRISTHCGDRVAAIPAIKRISIHEAD